jgi:hypothetical protein
MLKVSKADDEFFKFVECSELDPKLKLWELARLTSAALPYFSKYTTCGEDFIDGGFTYNNPSYLALKFLEKKGINLENIAMLSLGCNTDSESVSSGLKHLHASIMNLSSSFFSSLPNIKENMSNISYNTLLLVDAYLKKRFVRISPSEIKDIDIDAVDSKALFKLKKLAKLMLNCNTEKITRICKMLGYTIDYSEEVYGYFVLPRYFKYRECYKQLDSICTMPKFEKEDLDLPLLEFMFPQDVALSQSINYPKLGFWKNLFGCGARNTICSLCRAIAIGHLPSISINRDSVDLFHHAELNDWTPFHFAAANGEVGGLLILLKDTYFKDCKERYKSCLTIDYVDKLERTTLDKLVRQFESYQGTRYTGKEINENETPISVALRFDNKEFIQFYSLIKKRADDVYESIEEKKLDDI